MNFVKIFDEVSKQMQSDFEKSRQALQHSGLKGSVNEETVKRFLRNYLPRHLEISSGIAVDSHGGVSRQLDVIIHDANKTPIFYSMENSRVIPVECVYAAVEVKAYLDKCEIQKSFENMQSVKRLKKEAYFEPPSVIEEVKTLYGEKWGHWPVQHFIFAFDSPALASVISNVLEFQRTEPPHQWIDSICVLNKGVLFYQRSDGGYAPVPTPESQLVASNPEKSLLFFYMLLSVLLNQASMKNFNIKPYLRGINF
jgi:hypothetical protein